MSSEALLGCVSREGAWLGLVALAGGEAGMPRSHVGSVDMPNMGLGCHVTPRSCRDRAGMLG